MITRAELKKLRYFDKAIASANERIADISEQARGLTQQLTGIPYGTGHNDTMDRYVIKLEEIMDQLGDSVVRMLILEQKVRDAITALPEQQALVMHARYLEFNRRKGRRLSWAEVARATHYSVDHCKRIHTQALRRLCGE